MNKSNEMIHDMNSFLSMQFIKLKLLLHYNLIAFFSCQNSIFVVAWCYCYGMILRFHNRFNHIFSHLSCLSEKGDMIMSTNASELHKISIRALYFLTTL
jgi:hypothetical protein